ncbi:MAG TPA: STAS domain-containing protein [Bryobacteraceae bacterium]|jgi:anti-anti-sigma factor|nr:STAS domain-containing protein [Bryobacteraceae bacterium]
MEQMEIEQEPSRIADVTIFRLKGPFTLSTMFDFQAELRNPELKGSLIDLKDVSYMDSAGLGVLLGHYAHTQRGVYKFALTGVSPRLRTLFEITHTDQLLPIYPTQEDAEKTLESGS